MMGQEVVWPMFAVFLIGGASGVILGIAVSAFVRGEF
jgi:hypothetical protein